MQAGFNQSLPGPRTRMQHVHLSPTLNFNQNECSDTASLDTRIMSFQFVDEALDVRQRQRLIRSHVMKGKLAGRTHPSRTMRAKTKAAMTRSVEKANRSNSAEGLFQHRVHETDRTFGLSRLFWNDLSLVSFPVQLESTSRHLIYRCKNLKHRRKTRTDPRDRV
jgi:hypothetical protein